MEIIEEKEKNKGIKNLIRNEIEMIEKDRKILSFFEFSN